MGYIVSRELGLLYFLIGSTQCDWDFVERDLANAAARGLGGAAAQEAKRKFFAPTSLNNRLDQVAARAKTLAIWPQIESDWLRTRSAVWEAAEKRNQLIHHHRVAVASSDGQPKFASYDPKRHPDLNALPRHEIPDAFTLTLPTALRVWDHVQHAKLLTSYFQQLTLGVDLTWPIDRPGDLPDHGLTADQLERNLRGMLSISLPE